MDSYNNTNPLEDVFALLREMNGVSELSALSEDALSAIKADSCFFSAGRRAGGFAYVVHFPNGYGASIVKFFGTYGAEHDLWEVAVLREENGEWPLCYDTDITDDVLGHQEEDEVVAVCDAIRALV